MNEVREFVIEQYTKARRNYLLWLGTDDKLERHHFVRLDTVRDMLIDIGMTDTEIQELDSQIRRKWDNEHR